MNLSIRLQAVLTMISPTDVLADVGCDHGYLSKACLEKGVNYIQLIDNKIGPLRAAEKNLNAYLPTQTLKFSLADGLTELDEVVDTVAICGMGGNLIAKIISDSYERTKSLKKLILQANTKVELLRRFLSDYHFEIINEEIVEDAGFTYEIIEVVYNENARVYSEAECLMGPILLMKKPSLFIKKWHGYLAEINSILTSISKTKVNSSDRYAELIKQKTIITKNIMKK